MNNHIDEDSVMAEEQHIVEVEVDRLQELSMAGPSD